MSFMNDCLCYVFDSPVRWRNIKWYVVCLNTFYGGRFIILVTLFRRVWILLSVNKKRCRPKHVLHAGSLLVAARHLLQHLRVTAPQLLEDLANHQIPEEVAMVSVSFVWNDWVCLKAFLLFNDSFVHFCPQQQHLLTQLYFIHKSTVYLLPEPL